MAAASHYYGTSQRYFVFFFVVVCSLVGMVISFGQLEDLWQVGTMVYSIIISRGKSSHPVAHDIHVGYLIMEQVTTHFFRRPV